jgi:hypothetical protein
MSKWLFLGAAAGYMFFSPRRNPEEYLEDKLLLPRKRKPMEIDLVYKEHDEWGTDQGLGGKTIPVALPKDDRQKRLLRIRGWKYHKKFNGWIKD